MSMKLLGRTGIQVSPLCFGTMSFGGDADEAASAELYKAVRDKGINFLDCADVYVGGRSEEILGRLIAHERDQIVLTTKCHGPMGDGPNDGGLSRRHITSAVEASLNAFPDHMYTGVFLSRQAAAHLRLSDFQVAEGSALQAYGILEKALGPGHRRTTDVARLLRDIYSSSKRPEEAAEWNERAAAGMRAAAQAGGGG